MRGRCRRTHRGPRRSLSTCWWLSWGHCLSLSLLTARPPPWPPRGFLEHVRAVRADCEKKLEQKLVRRDVLRVPRPPILAADLAELARPVGQQERGALVRQRRVRRALRAVVADPRE